MTTIDLSDTIIAKSDQLNSADIADSITINITKATKKAGDQPISIFYDGDNGKPWKPCKSMLRVIARIWGSKVDMTGRSITLVCDPEVTWGGQAVGGIRISHMSNMEKKKTLPLRISKHKVAKYDVLPIKAAPKPKPAAPEPTVDEDGVIDDLVTAGNEAAALGVEGYTEWIATLDADDKPAIKKFHANWTAVAKAADEDGELAF